MDKIEKGNPLTQSADIVKENLETLKRLFPTIVKEGKIDVEELKALIDDEVETSEEYYRFTWAGKSEARREANKTSTGTLRPNKADSKNWNTTGNIFIEGDNLEVLKLMKKSYAGKIQMMYFDPPYNTGKDFVYKDNYKDNLGNYLEISNQVDGEGNKLNTNTESDGRYHSNWLNMLYPRLKISHNLLKESGVIFISIDDNEVFNLRKLLDEIFGEENFVACLPTVMNLKGNNDEFGFAGTHEYTIVYIKNIESVDDLYGIKLTDEDILDYTLDDGYGKYKKGATLMRTGIAGAREKRPKGYYPIYVSKDLSKISLTRMNDDDFEIFPKTKKGKEMSWRRSPENLQSSLNEFIVIKSGNSISFYKKQRLKDDLINGKKAKSLFYKPQYSSGNGTDELKKLFGEERIFDNPKPLELIKDFISTGLKDGIILDIFAGSGTTAHATMQLNSDDNGNRKFICIQLPEPTDTKSVAYKSGFSNISKITKERIRLAGSNIISVRKAELENLKMSIEGKILQEDIQSQIDILQSTIDNLDIGFKAFKLDSSNIHSWDGSVENFEANLFNAQNNIKADRSEEDVLFEILLKYGLDLTVPIQEKAVGKCNLYSIGSGVLFICLSDNITTEVANAIGEWKNELEPATCRVLFKDNGFINDVAKTNSVQILRQYGIEECNSI